MPISACTCCAARIVFADLALAQLSALGATVAFANGYAATSAAGFGYALLFTAIGAALLTLTRRLARFVSQEAFVGIVYVVATAATMLVVDRSPQGAEHVKKILVGSILTVDPADAREVRGALRGDRLLPLAGAATADRVCRASATPRRAARLAVWVWDFVFFLSFAIVVTSSVATAGVLLVFSLLIVPAVIGSIFASKIGPCSRSHGRAALRRARSVLRARSLDLPTGAAMVVAFAGFCCWPGSPRVAVRRPEQRRRTRRAAIQLAAAMLLALLASSVWLMVNPHADQPLLAASNMRRDRSRAVSRRDRARHL